MDRIIERISAIENDSVKIMDEAAAKKKEIADQFHKETEVFDQKLEADTARRIEKLRAAMEAEMKKKLNDQKNQANDELKRIERHYANKRQLYVEQLFKEMTGA